VELPLGTHMSSRSPLDLSTNLQPPDTRAATRATDNMARQLMVETTTDHMATAKPTDQIY
jgi:hypothetical protein